MFCSQCGHAAHAGDRFCTKCGASLQADDAVQAFNPQPAQAEPSAPAAAPVRPWIRYWARMFDLYAFAICAGFCLGIVAPHFIAGMNDVLLGMLMTLAWVFVEAVLLASFQTTPGKWLFKIKLASVSGEPISYSQAFNRSLLVWWRGLGTGFPIVSLVTLVKAYRNLKDTGSSSWDTEGGFTVTHEKVGVLRILAAIATLFAVIFLVALGSAAIR